MLYTAENREKCEPVGRLCFPRLPLAYSLLTLFINPIAVRKAKIMCNFGLPECSRISINLTVTEKFSKKLLL